MRETRPSGSEGRPNPIGRPYPYDDNVVRSSYRWRDTDSGAIVATRRIWDCWQERLRTSSMRCDFPPRRFLRMRKSAGRRGSPPSASETPEGESNSEIAAMGSSQVYYGERQ
jgi:hypothetical protein